MTDVSIDWASPIRLPRRSVPFGVRQEQIRRAEILVTAAGGKKPKSSRGWAPRLEALAAVVPGLRYSIGPFTYRTLAPDVPLIMSAAHDPSKPRPGRPTVWSDDRLLVLLAMVEQIKSENGKPLTDALALGRVKKRLIAHGKALADAEGRPFDAEAKKRAELPSVRRLESYLADARNLRRL